MVYTQDLKSCAPDRACGFESHHQHHFSRSARCILTATFPWKAAVVDATPLKPCQSLGRLGQDDTLRVRVAAEQRSDMTDPLDEHRLGLRANGGDQRFAGQAIFGINPNLDQFMMVQRQQNFVQNRWRQTVIADNHHRLAMMSQGLEMTLLWMSKREHEKNHDG